MDKKYQVFISSTYTDMKAERQAAVEAVLDAGHIPAGMELFAASDKKQIDVIKRWIDRSDIFMLILGGRYGSVEKESGKSYIQLEYEYAIETGKPMFALYLTDKAIDQKVAEKGREVTEQDDTKSFKEFRATVMSKMCRSVDDFKDILIQAPKAIRDLAESGKLEGWVRASSVTDVSPLLAEMASLRKENDELKKARGNSGVSVLFGLGATANGGVVPSLDIPLTLCLDLEYAAGSFGIQKKVEKWSGTYADAFALIAPNIFERPYDSSLKNSLSRLLKEKIGPCSKAEVRESDYNKLKIQLVKLGVMEMKEGQNGVRWALTEAGRLWLLQNSEA